MRAIRTSAQTNRKFLRPRLEEHHVGKFGRMGSRGKHGKMFLPGEPVPETGIYEVIHDRDHRASHEVVMHGQDLFPACDQCDTRVRFKLIRTAPYIFDDEDFVEE